MNLFIDANVFLNFYHLSGGDIEELKKLVALVENGDIVLFSCPQLREEIKRNRDAKVSDAMREFKRANLKVSFPAFTKHYEEYDEVRDLLTKANKKHAELVSAALEDVNSRSLAADRLIDELLDRATEIEHSDAIYLAALKRFRMGNPPGKKKATVGDEMNWEALLVGVPNGEDLFFVSGDGDYCSALDEHAFHSFLLDEWNFTKGASLHFFKSLSALLEVRFPQIRVAIDVEKARLIEELSKSRSFATTHAIIDSLSGYEFSTDEVEQLVTIAEHNNQVGWILDDHDVAEFYVNLFAKHGDNLKNSTRTMLKEILNLYDDLNFDEDEVDIPF